MDYIDSNPGIVDADEYSEMMRNMDRIVREVLAYVDDYVSYCNKSEKHISDEEFQRRYRYSSLQYFHEILGVNH
ncbi:MAG: hypothetical protein IK139_00770 [Lachnospiraceae bacterium]|nr:hypothetical protein [Lachnospiraceae bacterium]